MLNDDLFKECSEQKKLETIPYFAHEGDMARMERTVRRLWVAVLVAITLIFASNLAWLWCWMQFDYVSTESSVDVNAKYGVANYIGNDGDIVNGKDQGNETD